MKNLRLLALLWIVLVSATLVGCESNKDENIDKSGDFIIEDVTWENDAVIDYNDNLVDIASACIELAARIFCVVNKRIRGAFKTDITRGIVLGCLLVRTSVIQTFAQLPLASVSPGDIFQAIPGKGS